MKQSIVVLLSAIVAMLALASGAGAAVTLGSELANPATDGVFCAAACTHVQSVIPGRVTASPVDGVIVRWRVRTDAPGGPFSLKIARPATGDDRTGAGTSAEVTTAAGGVSEFATRLPVRQGDNIGLNFTSANAAKFKSSVNIVGAQAPYFSPLLVDGTTRTPNIVNTGTELLFNADVESDIDGDGYGDESQDACPAIPGPTEGCDRVSPKFTKKVTARQRVTKFAAYVTSDESGQATARAVVRYKSGGKTRTITGKLAKVKVTAAKRAKLTLKFSSRQLKKLRALIAAGKKPRAKVSISVADPSGNKAQASAYVKLKR